MSETTPKRQGASCDEAGVIRHAETLMTENVELRATWAALIEQNRRLMAEVAELRAVAEAAATYVAADLAMDGEPESAQIAQRAFDALAALLQEHAL